MRELESKTAIHPDWVKKIFELGYRRGYADCAEYVEEWIEDEEG